MGHKRNICLPKTKPWLAIVEELADYALGKSEIAEIAKQTLRNVQSQYNKLENDPSVNAAFEFLIKVSVAFKQDDPIKYLKDNEILETDDFSVLKLARAATNYKNKEINSHEYETFAKQAVVDALNYWYTSNIDQGTSLFNSELDSTQIFRKVSDGRGFCEVSRLFFAKFTERYLKYFLEREASSHIGKVSVRDKFNQELESNIGNISKHAFETAKITQSFAAGWFNKHAKEKVPSEQEIKGFLAHSFGKMRRELLEEELN